MNKEMDKPLPDGGCSPQGHMEMVLAAISSTRRTRSEEEIESDLKGIDGIVPLVVADDPPEDLDRIIVGVENYDAVQDAIRVLHRNGFFITDLREGDSPSGAPDREVVMVALRNTGPVELERLREIEQDFRKVPMDIEDLQAETELSTEFAIPVRINTDTARAYDVQGRRSVEQGLEIHYPKGLDDDVHKAVAEVIGSSPEKHNNSAAPSQLPSFDLFLSFGLRRDDPTEPWENARFKPSTLFRLLEPYADEIVAVSDGSLI